MVAVHADRRESDLTPSRKRRLDFGTTPAAARTPSVRRRAADTRRGPEPVALRFAIGPNNRDNRISIREPIFSVEKEAA